MNTNHYDPESSSSSSSSRGETSSTFAGSFGSATREAFIAQRVGGAFGSYGGGFVSHSGGFGSGGAFGPHGTLEPNVALPHPLLPTQRSLQHQQSVHPHSIAVAVAAAAPELPVQQDDVDVDDDETVEEEEHDHDQDDESENKQGGEDDNVEDEDDEQDTDEQDANKQDANKQDANEQDANEQETNEQETNEQDNTDCNTDNNNNDHDHDHDEDVDVVVDEKALEAELADLRRHLDPLERDHDKATVVFDQCKLVLDDVRPKFETAQKEYDVASTELEKLHGQFEPRKRRECEIHKTLQGHRGVVLPIDRDVLCGVYAKDSHKGNKWYMEQMRRNRSEYNELTCKADRDAFVRERLVLCVYERGGRFLESKKSENNGGWREISVKEACVKAGRTFRRNRNEGGKTKPTGPPVTDVREADVLCMTRSNARHRDHPGNQAYFAKLQSLLPEIRSVKTPQEKKEIVRSLIKDVSERDGRFLWKRLPTDSWRELGPEETFVKVRDAFWEANRKGRRGKLNIMLMSKEEREEKEAQIRERKAIRDEKRRQQEAKKKERIELIERKKAAKEAAAAAAVAAKEAAAAVDVAEEAGAATATKRRKKEVETATAKVKTPQEKGKKRQRVSTGKKDVVAVVAAPVSIAAVASVLPNAPSPVAAVASVLPNTPVHILPTPPQSQHQPSVTNPKLV